MADGAEPTAWEEINPATALARPPEQRLPSLDLRPASNEVFRNELTACLILVAPVGMTEDSRREWLAVAWETLRHLPPDMLARGCETARETCDHPSKIVPAIIAETKDWWEMRRGNHSYQPSVECLPAPTRRHVLDRRGEAMTEEDTDELNGILEKLGATARYNPDGSKYVVAA